MHRMVAVPKNDERPGISPPKRRLDMADNGTILVVDDDVAILQMLAIMLEEAGYTVVKASDGREALGMAEAHRPDLVLLDFMMPNMDGCTACLLLKSAENTRSLPVVLMSADRQVIEKAIEARADDYLLKPFNIEEMLDRVRSCLVPAGRTRPE